MEPAEPLPVKLTLEDPEFKSEKILLIHHSMFTPSDIKFSVLRNLTQNFKYRGTIWLTDKNLVYKGFPIRKMGVTKVSDKLVKPFCEIDSSQPFQMKIDISKISEIFSGHDSTFQRRFQRYPKLRITYRENGGVTTIYFYLTRENLIDDELYINKRCSEWQNKINELRGESGGAPTVPAKPSVPTMGAPRLPVAPSAASATSAPSGPRIGTDALLKKAAEEVEAKRFGKVVVKPLEEREKPAFTPVAAPIQSETEEEAPAFTKLLDALVPVSDDEFTAAAADSSISKCPHCGWILGYATTKCPRCRKTI